MTTAGARGAGGPASPAWPGIAAGAGAVVALPTTSSCTASQFHLPDRRLPSRRTARTRLRARLPRAGADRRMLGGRHRARLPALRTCAGASRNGGSRRGGGGRARGRLPVADRQPLHADPPAGAPDDGGMPALRTVLLATDRAGFGNLCELITLGRRRSEGSYRLHPQDTAASVEGAAAEAAEGGGLAARLARHARLRRCCCPTTAPTPNGCWRRRNGAARSSARAPG